MKQRASFLLLLSVVLLAIPVVWIGQPGTGIESTPVPAGPSPQAGQISIAGRPVELLIAGVSPHTVRISLVPLRQDGRETSAPNSIALAERQWPEPTARLKTVDGERTIKLGNLQVRVSTGPLTLTIEDNTGTLVQQLRINQETGAVSFRRGNAPILGLGEGGQQFDRRGAFYPMRSGQGAWQLEYLGGRVPMPWLIGTEGWAMLVHQPLGTFDLSGQDALFEPQPSARRLPLDIFVVSGEPTRIMSEYASLSGQPHMPPLWALGYQQSHRTLANRETVMSVAKTLRDKKLPADVLIYLGTGFCPSGWNTGHRSWAWNPRAFPDPPDMVRELHDLNFKVILHLVDPPERLFGRAADKGADSEDESNVANYWKTHLEVFRLGIDGWWPDEGDPLDHVARLTRNRMYWEAPQLDQPNQRPYALHRNGYVGMQRWAWLWSGDVDSTWRMLRMQVPVGINTALSGVHLWGTDTGGFVPTREFTGELYVRWFQFSAFTPLFRSHGRAWKLRLPWGWNTGDLGPPELEGYGRNAWPPDTKELFNEQVEPICRKYMELRYRLMPYLYSAVREAHETGVPMMRALWLHYPDDAKAVARSDEYLWGRDLLVAPVTERGAASRSLYLPRGSWYDFWTEERVEGGRELNRQVDLATMPLYSRAGSILAMGPVEQHTAENPADPLNVIVYPGADGRQMIYEDDGTTFNFTQGEFMKLNFTWNDKERRLQIALEPGTKMLPPLERTINARVAGQRTGTAVRFSGKPVEVRF